MKIFITILLMLNCLYTNAQEPIIIGLNADMSAVAKEGGVAIQRGAEIAIAEINERGGVLNRPLKLIIKNHRGNPARAINNLKALNEEEDLVAVIGGVHTPVALKELPLVHQNQIIYLGPWAAGTPIVDNGYKPNYVFRISVRDEEAAKVMIPFAKKRGLNRVGLVLERTGWGRSNEVSMKAAALKNDIEITQVSWVNWGQTNFENEVKALESSDIQAIMLVSNAPEGASFIKEMLKQKSRLPIISHWGIASGNFVERVGLDALNKLDISILQTYSFSKPHNEKLNSEVLKRYHQSYGVIPAISIPGTVGTAHSYDLVHLLAKAIVKAGTTDRPSIRNELEQLPTYSGLVKDYQPAFTKTQHDGLLSHDYMMSTFDQVGNLIPLQD